MFVIISISVLVVALAHLVAAAPGGPNLEVQVFSSPRCRGQALGQEYISAPSDTCLAMFGGTDTSNVVDISTGQIVFHGATDVSFTCNAPSTYVGNNNCDKHLHKTIGSYCFALYAPDGHFIGGIRLSCFPCRPYPTTTKAHCERTIQKCHHLEGFNVGGPPIPLPPANMKWTGKGCRSDTGKPLGDGGCQCDGYCGYGCEEACNADSQCYWDTNTNSCFQAANNLPGHAISPCPQDTNSIPKPGAPVTSLNLLDYLP